MEMFKSLFFVVITNNVRVRMKRKGLEGDSNLHQGKSVNRDNRTKSDLNAHCQHIT